MPHSPRRPVCRRATGRGGPGGATVTGVRHGVLLADEFILVERCQIFAGPRQYHDRETRRRP